MKTPTCILIDDDILVYLSWRVRFQEAGKSLVYFSSGEEFLRIMHEYARSVPIFLDVGLGSGMSGTKIAPLLHSAGFTQIYLATGHSPDAIQTFPWVREVRGKEIPVSLLL